MLHRETICLCDGTVADVSFEYLPSSRGYRGCWGVPEEMDEPDDIDIESVVVDGVDVFQSVSDDDLEFIADQILGRMPK